MKTSLFDKCESEIEQFLEFGILPEYEGGRKGCVIQSYGNLGDGFAKPGFGIVLFDRFSQKCVRIG